MRQRNAGKAQRRAVDFRFPGKVGMVIVGAAILLAYPLAAFGSRETVVATIAGAGLSTVNILIGYLTIEYSFRKSYSAFLKAVLGGMGVRMAMVLGMMIALILQFEISPLALTISMFGFYVVYLVMEILYIQEKVEVKNQG